ncbi:hypothetical protein H312_01884, partial [Anncaliia algerae PRA339]
VLDEVRFINLSHNLLIGSNHTIVDWLNLFREICLGHFLRHPILIGGPGHVIEIDECQLMRRRHNIGHIVVVAGSWVLMMLKHMNVFSLELMIKGKIHYYPLYYNMLEKEVQFILTPNFQKNFSLHRNNLFIQIINCKRIIF